MTPLATELLKPEYAGLTDQQAFDKIAQPVETLNNQAWTVDAINDALPSDVNIVLGTLESAPLFRSAFIALSISGLELASEKRQEMIDVLADIGQWSNELRSSVKQLGRPMVAPWKQIGLPSEPTLQEVSEAFAETKAWQAKEAIRFRLDSAYNQIGTSEQPLAIAELRDIANLLEG